MQSNSPLPNINYSLANGGNSTSPLITVFKTQDPTIYDIQYPVKQRWLNVTSSREWILTGFSSNAGITTANWLQLADGNSVLDFVVPSGTSPVNPDLNGQITFTSNDGSVNITGSANAIDFGLSDQYTSDFGVPNGTSPITPDANGLVNFTSTNGTITVTGSAGGAGLQNINFETTTPSLLPWTPTLFGSVTAGTSTYSTQAGTYKIVGGIVFAQFAVIGNTTGGSGDVVIGGLPYPNNSQTNCYGTCIDTNFTWPLGTSSIVTQIGQGQNFMRILASGSGAVFDFVQISNTGFNVQGSIFYSI